MNVEKMVAIWNALHYDVETPKDTLLDLLELLIEEETKDTPVESHTTETREAANKP